ncbi:MAG: hypothetical protein NUW21_05815 [Elusimicrobia bacterium]|nr:hypothetical protein [Elusimicrobiota bacterium]
MSRREKLFDRLDALEARFRILLSSELERETRDIVSGYLLDKRRSGYRSTRKSEEIDDVEDEILALRSRTGESVADSWVSIANEIAARDSTANDVRYNQRIPRAAVVLILGSLRGADGVPQTKEVVRASLTAQKGSTGYRFNKDVLTKGLSYPIKRQALDQVILESGTEEIGYVWYARRQYISSRRPLEDDEFREGELLLRADFRTSNGGGQIDLHLYALPSSETPGLKPHIEKIVLPTLLVWLKTAKSASVEWRSRTNFLEIGWQLGELVVRRG